MRKQLILPFLIFLFLTIGTVLLVLYGKGYRFESILGKPKLQGTGLLVATSQPDGAQVFINGHLTTATNNTINLPPETYNIKIVKFGYFPWEKTIKIQKEVVSVTGALLFTTAPKLESITEIGVSDPIIDPSGTKLAYTVASQSARKNGVYILDMTSRPILTLQSASSQIADDTENSFSQAKLTWSPDGQELFASLPSPQKPESPTTYLLKSNGFNQNPQDITETIESILLVWEKERENKEKSRIDGLNTKVKKLINENFKIVSWSQDETKILYTASHSAKLPLIINPALIGTDSTPQERSIQKDSFYVYDIKEDKNYKIGNWKLEIGNSQGSLPLNWFPDSKHLLFVNNRKISIMEYDGTNNTVIFAGPFIDNYAFPWPDGSKIVVLTNLGNTNITPNLYTIGLK
ncbi:MAG: PEGA domain-containing protein [Patescibacteria group bacterium]